MGSFKLLVVVVGICITLVTGEKLKIGIIGGGIGGTSCAYFLHQLLPDAELEVLEANRVGGRLATEEIGGRRYEVGGSIIHPLNSYMVNHTKLFGLEQLPVVPGVLGLHDGKEFVFLGSESTWQTILALGWRYGTDMLTFNSLIEELMGKFKRIYDVQDAGNAFTTVEDILSAISPDYAKMMRRPFEEYLKEIGFSDLFITEFAEAVSLVNYGQPVDNLKGFVGAATLAAASEDLWAVKGGNHLVAESFLKTSGAQLTSCQVSSVKQMADGQFQVFCAGSTQPLATYTHVVISAPLISNGQETIKIETLKPIEQPVGPYKRRFATLVEGTLKTDFFGGEQEDLPDQLFLCNSSKFFHSVARQRPTVPVEGDQPDVYKVFSNEQLSQEQLDTLFTSTSHKAVEWMAFPDYSVIDKEKYPFELADNLYYPNNIEWAASAMEMMVVSARNTALLISNRVKGQLDKINPKLTIPQEEDRSEL